MLLETDKKASVRVTKLNYGDASHALVRRVRFFGSGAFDSGSAPAAVSSLAGAASALVRRVRFFGSGAFDSGSAPAAVSSLTGSGRL
jgi:hypothetical protein